MHRTRTAVWSSLMLAVALAGCRSTPPPAAPPAAEPGRCEADADCTASAFDRAVAGPEDCYCPVCPAPRTAVEASAFERQWQAVCAGEWVRQAGCANPSCARPPGRPGCRQHACTWVVGEP